MVLKKIQLKFLGSLRHDLNRPSLLWPIETNTSVRLIVAELTQDPQYEELRSFFSETLEVKRSLLVFLNDQEISALSGMDTLVQQDDTLAFIPVIHGGTSS
ncbi:MAG: MoaD/ThiS family protein [Candidatus Heimdallarchaeota archaeon]